MEEWTVDDLKLSLSFTQVYDSLSLLKLSREHLWFAHCGFLQSSVSWASGCVQHRDRSCSVTSAGWQAEGRSGRSCLCCLPLFPSKRGKKESLEGLGKQKKGFKMCSDEHGWLKSSAARLGSLQSDSNQQEILPALPRWFSFEKSWQSSLWFFCTEVQSGVTLSWRKCQGFLKWRWSLWVRALSCWGTCPVEPFQQASCSSYFPDVQACVPIMCSVLFQWSWPEAERRFLELVFSSAVISRKTGDLQESWK